MSKYTSLSQPVFCEWVYPGSDSICGHTFTSMVSFIDHIRSNHFPNTEPAAALQMEQHLSGVCYWNGCNFTTLSASSPEYLSHILFHPYHTYLKLLGSEVQQQRQLTDCQLDPNMSNLLPPLEVELQCLWNEGQCGVVFDSVGEFYRHVHEHVMTAKQFSCLWKDCSFKGRDRTKVNEHVRSHLKEKQVACPTCGALFSNNTKLADHLVRQQVSDGSLSCSFCHKTFASERLLRDHARRHVNTLQCPQCQLTCQGPSRLLAHIRYRHMANKPHECPLCHKTFKTAPSLSEHIETHRESHFNCSWPGCDFKCSNTRSLDRHIKTIHDSTSMLYCCHICNERFTVGRKLTTHLKTVHGFQLPPGHCRFRYVPGVDGLKRLQTVRLDDENIVTPELNIYSTASTSSDQTQVLADPTA